VSILVACSDDDDGGDPTCNSGYVLKGGVCVKPSDNSGGSGTTAGTTSTAGAEQGGAGAGAGAVDSGGETALGGTGGDPDAGGMGGEAQVPYDVAPTRWLAFSHEKGVFAYDTTKFTAKDALISLSKETQSVAPQRLSWSPDGLTLLYLDVADVYAVDLSGDAPVAPRLLLSSPTDPSPQLDAVRPWSWSADSESVAVVSGTTLSVLDPTQAAPTLHPLTTKLESFSWAPYGGRLLYADDTGSHVVQVTAGSPGTPLEVDAGATIWSPNGAQLAGIKDGDLALTTLSDEEASLELLTTAQASDDPPPALDAQYIRFNKSGSSLTFSGQLAVGEDFTGYTLSLKPRGEPVAVPSGAAEGAETACHSWSPDGALLLCSYEVAAGSQWFAVDVAAQASTPVLEGGAYAEWAWSPDPTRYQLFTSSVGGASQIAMVDLEKPSALVPIFMGSTTFSVSPTGALLTYLNKPIIRLVDLAALQKMPVEIQTAQSATDPPVWGWSPNGLFIAIADGSHQQRLARIDGAAASTPVALGEASAIVIDFAWQP
jgi:Tol biopolymer transport system component